MTQPVWMTYNAQKEFYRPMFIQIGCGKSVARPWPHFSWKLAMSAKIQTWRTHHKREMWESTISPFAEVQFVSVPSLCNCCLVWEVLEIPFSLTIVGEMGAELQVHIITYVESNWWTDWTQSWQQFKIQAVCSLHWSIPV